VATTCTPEKDYYSVLGVEPTASHDQIDAAYRARVRISHPDRFDKDSQPEEWDIANEILRDLNAAYEILREAQTRHNYDSLRSRQSSQPTSEKTPKGVGFSSPCSVRCQDLSNTLQQRLVERQESDRLDQFRISTGGVGGKFVAIIGLLVWFLFLSAFADGAKWNTWTNIWLFAITAVVGWLISGRILAIVKWFTSTLKSHFYITPFYFIKTDCDIVTFWPIFALRDIAVTHNYTNGIYQGSTVLLKFESHIEQVSLPNKAEVENLFLRIREYDAKLRHADAINNNAYFQQHDDFEGVPRTGIPAEYNQSPSLVWRTRAAVLAACGVIYFFFFQLNDDLAAKKWVDHGKPSIHHAAAPPRRVPKPQIPRQPLPLNGEVQTFYTAERIAPFEIRTSGRQHYLVKLVDVITKTPVLTVFVEGGRTVTLDVPLGTYEVRYTCGNSWYGYKYLFGDSGSYSKADQTFTFSRSLDQVGGYTITLYPVANGNLNTRRIAPTEF